jgi:hypothetical protein
VEAETVARARRRRVYAEGFDDGPGGWWAWQPGQALAPEIRDGILHTRSPWWVDPNHAPPGAGYLHLLAFLLTSSQPAGATPAPGGPSGDGYRPVRAAPNRFVAGGYSRDLTNARVTIRVRGAVALRGAELVLLAQADLPGTRANYILTGQPFRVSSQWSDQTATLAPDPAQWVCLGARRDLTHVYGCGEIGDVLRDVNVDIILVLFPLRIVPLGRVDDLHGRRTHRDYAVDYRHLPEGEIQIDTIRIEYPDE